MIYVLFVFLLLVSYTDIKYRKIYNWQICSVFIICLSLYLQKNTSNHVLMLANIGIVIFISVFAYISGFWAGGDTKLFISLAPLFTPYEIAYLIFHILSFGGVISMFYIFKLYLKKEKSESIICEIREHKGVPYGVAISLAIITQYITALSSF